MSASLRLASLAALVALAGCSVLVDPDLSRLSYRADGAVADTPADTAPADAVPTDVPIGQDRGIVDVPDAHGDDVATDVTHTDVPPGDVTDAAPTDVTDASPTDVTDVPPTDVPRDVPPTDVAPTDVPTTDVPTDVPGTRCPGGCNDMIPCTVDTCDEATGRCVFRADSALCGDRGVCDPARMGCVMVDCTNDTQCQNATVCDGRESCVDNRCVPGTPIVCDDSVACTVDACNPTTGACTNVATNSRCDDGRFCNGAETCSATAGCVRGTAPNCDDGIPCTMDACSETTRACTHTANSGACPTRGPCVSATCTLTAGCVYSPIPRFCEGFCVTGGTCDVGSGSCTGGGTPRDCSDMNPCTADTCDPMAMMCRSAPVDADRDGAPAQMVAGATCAGGTDCNDSNPLIHPGATEVCDGVDNNCNGMIDEGLTCTAPGDTCARPIPIDLTGRTMVSLMGTTAGANADLSDACGGRTGDVFYSVTFPATANVTFEAVPVDAGVNPVLSLRRDCGSDAFVCNDDAAAATGATARIWVRPTATSGTVTAIVMVKMVDRAGAFRLNVSLADPGTAAAVCASTAQFDVTAGGSMYGVFGAGTSQHRAGNCTTVNVSNTTTEDVVVFRGTARVVTTLNTVSPVVYTRGGRCTSGGSIDLRCAVGTTSASITTDFTGGGWIFSDAGTSVNRTFVLVVYPQ